MTIAALLVLLICVVPWTLGALFTVSLCIIAKRADEASARMTR